MRTALAARVGLEPLVRAFVPGDRLRIGSRLDLGSPTVGIDLGEFGAEEQDLGRVIDPEQDD